MSKKGVPQTPRLPAPGMVAERTLSELTRLLSERDFESEEEFNDFLAKMVGGEIAAARRGTASEEVWDLLEEAAASDNPKRRTTLARRILALDPDNADAYILLADQANTRAEALALLTDAVRAGERAIDGDMEALAAEGAMWLTLETRPYMRARVELAAERWAMGDRQVAIDELWEMLRLNPNDNQGVRYILLAWLLQAGSLSAIDRLLALYPDEDAATWAYDRALHAFRSMGDSPESRKLIALALRQNPHVPRFLLGLEPMPEELPEYIGFGDETEAAAYASGALLRWSEYPDAFDWLIAKAGARARTGKRGAGRARNFKGR